MTRVEGAEGLSPAIIFIEIGDSGENINNGILNVQVIPLLRWNAEDRGEGGRPNGLNVQESEYVQNKVGRWLK